MLYVFFFDRSSSPIWTSGAAAPTWADRRKASAAADLAMNSHQLQGPRTAVPNILATDRANSLS